MMLRKIQNLDYFILLVIGCFMVVSTFLIYSATSGNSKFAGMHITNIITFGVLFVPLLVTAFFDYRILVKYFSYILYGLGIVLLLLVMFKGENINFAQRWINIGGVQFQPSEVVKIFLILIIANIMKRRQGQPLRFKWDIVLISLAVIVPFILVYKQPDLGTAIVFVSIFIGMLWMGNMRFTHILVGIVTLIVIVGTVISLYFIDIELFSKVIKPKQLERIETFLDPTMDPETSWHVVNSIKAVSMGQLFGTGFKQGYFVQNNRIPYDYADSIYVVIGEEFGFFGSAVLLLLYFLLIYRMIRIIIECSDLTGAYIIVGVLSMLTLQIFENVAMHIGLMPLTGIALPFVSYGGSSLLTYMIAIGLVLSVKIHHAQPSISED